MTLIGFEVTFLVLGAIIGVCALWAVVRFFRLHKAFLFIGFVPILVVGGFFGLVLFYQWIR